MANHLEQAFQRAMERFLPDESEDDTSEDEMWLSLHKASMNSQSVTTRRINDKSHMHNQFAAEIRHAFKKLDEVCMFGLLRVMGWNGWVFCWNLELNPCILMNSQFKVVFYIEMFLFIGIVIK